MATPRKTAAGTWRIEIEVNGVRDSVTLPTRRAAVEWAAVRAMEIKAGAGGTLGAMKTLGDAFKDYAEKVSEKRRGWKKELIRLDAFGRHVKMPLKKRMADITPQDLAQWRDARLAMNARGSVLRDMGLLSAVFEVARKEWGWITSNPMRSVSKPANPDHRERVISGAEIRGMLRALGYRRGEVRTVGQAVAHAFLMALATGMRAGEICGLRWADVQPAWVRLEMTKNGSARNVPLSSVARRIVDAMRGWDEALVFGLKSQSLDAMFRKYRARAGLSGFTFHDARHTAATRMGRQGRVHVLELCKIFGWKNTKQALVYFNPSAADLAAKLG